MRIYGNEDVMLIILNKVFLFFVRESNILRNWILNWFIEYIDC